MPTRAFALLSAARGARRCLWWLAYVLAAAHCVATWHVYSHGAAQQSERPARSAHAGPDSCVLCLASAGIGGAPAAAALPHLAGLKQPEPAPPSAIARQAGAPPRPYAIRAPPLLAA